MSQRVSLVGGTDVNPFTTLAAMGYRNLVPIVPPGADISPRSTLFTRVGTAQDGRGKTPGIKNRDGLWSGFDWLPYVSDDSDYARWNAMGAGCGIKTGRDGVVAIDADTMDETSAKIILDIVEGVTGTAGTVPIRIGQHPKALYVFRCDEDLKYARVEFGAKPKGEHGEGKAERVEILAGGRQFVAWGLHPKTSAPYRWARKLVRIEDLPKLTGAQLEAIWAALRERLPAASSVIREGSGADVDQAALLGDLATVERAVNALPNANALFPSRESYRDVGYAIKAAGGDFDLWWSWCERWDGGVNDHGVAEADWSRMKPPFKRGASWLYEQAAEHSGGKFGLADAWFDDLGEAVKGAGANTDLDVYAFATVSEIMARPPVRWLVDRHIPRDSIGFLYSAPGVGKSFLALDLALSITSGFSRWHGDRVDAGDAPCVVYIMAEGAGGLPQRLAAWRLHNGDALKEAGGEMGAGLRVLERTIDFMKPADVGKLVRSVRASVAGTGLRPCLVVVDTVSRALPGADENMQKDMTLFVTACDAVRIAFPGSAVLGVHHAGKSGDMRGSTVLRGAGDFVFKMERVPGATLAKLTCEKQKDGADGWTDRYALVKTVLPSGDERVLSSLTVSRLGAEGSGEAATALGSDGTGGTLTEACLSAMAKAWADGEPWSKSRQAGDRRAIRRMADEFGVSAAESERLLLLWEEKGWIKHVLHSSKTHRYGFRVVVEIGQIVGQKPFENGTEDIFG